MPRYWFLVNSSFKKRSTISWIGKSDKKCTIQGMHTYLDESTLWEKQWYLHVSMHGGLAWLLLVEAFVFSFLFSPFTAWLGPIFAVAGSTLLPYIVYDFKTLFSCPPSWSVVGSASTISSAWKERAKALVVRQSHITILDDVCAVQTKVLVLMLEVGLVYHSFGLFPVCVYGITCHFNHFKLAVYTNGTFQRQQEPQGMARNPCAIRMVQGIGQCEWLPGSRADILTYKNTQTVYARKVTFEHILSLYCLCNPYKQPLYDRLIQILKLCE